MGVKSQNQNSCDNSLQVGGPGGARHIDHLTPRPQYLDGATVKEMGHEAETQSWQRSRVVRTALATGVALVALVVTSLGYIDSSFGRCEATEVEPTIEITVEGDRTTTKSNDGNGDGLRKTESCRPLGATDLVPAVRTGWLATASRCHRKVAFGQVLSIEFEKVMQAADEAKAEAGSASAAAEMALSQIAVIQSQQTEVTTEVGLITEQASELSAEQVQFTVNESFDFAGALKEVRELVATAIGQQSLPDVPSGGTLEGFLDHILQLEFMLNGLAAVTMKYGDFTFSLPRPKFELGIFNLYPLMLKNAVGVRHPELDALVRSRESQRLTKARQGFENRFSKPIGFLVLTKFLFTNGMNPPNQGFDSMFETAAQLVASFKLELSQLPAATSDPDKRKPEGAHPQEKQANNAAPTTD